jgi:hypothetical protein
MLGNFGETTHIKFSLPTPILDTVAQSPPTLRFSHLPSVVLAGSCLSPASGLKI